MKNAIISLVIVSTMATTGHAMLVNSGFEDGNLNGWTTYTTTNGKLGAPPLPDVQLFDTNGDSFASNSARFEVGQVLWEGLNSTPRGGGIGQSVNLLDGDLTIDVDIAVRELSGSNLGSAGLFELMFDGAVVDTHDFSGILANATERSTLQHTIASVAAGSHNIAIQMTRPFTLDVYQYIDNVNLSGTAVAIPEPSAMLFGGMIVIAIGARRSAKKLASLRLS